MVNRAVERDITTPMLGLKFDKVEEFIVEAAPITFSVISSFTFFLFKDLYFSSY